MGQTEIAGYAYGRGDLPRSPISLEELERLKETLLWTSADDQALRLSREVLADQVEQILDTWYGFVGSKPYLLYYFTRRQDGQPDTAYLEAVRRRFGQWILDTASANYDQAWLDYQAEIGRRHHRTGKNRTDGVDSVDIVHLRYLLALVYPVTFTLREFLANKGHSQEEVEAMYQAWLKSVLLQAILWSQPYAHPGDF